MAWKRDYEPNTGDDPRALTRVIGQCCFNADKNLLETVSAVVPVVRVQFQPGDLLLLASDGLLECINEPTAQDRFARLEAELRRLHLTDHPLKQVVVHLIRARRGWPERRQHLRDRRSHPRGRRGGR